MVTFIILLLLCLPPVSCHTDRETEKEDPGPSQSPMAIISASFSPPAVTSGDTVDVVFEACVQAEEGPEEIQALILDLSVIGLSPVDLLIEADRFSQGKQICFRYHFHTDGRSRDTLCVPLSSINQAGAGETVCAAFLSGFSWGIVFSPDAWTLKTKVKEISDLGVRFGKFWLDWSAVQQRALYYHPALGEISDQALPGYRFPLHEDLDRDPALIDEMAHPEQGGRFAGMVDWAPTDEIVEALTSEGISPLPLIGDATTAPHLVLDDENSIRLAPEAPSSQYLDCHGERCVGYQGIGRQEYLGQISLHAAGAARRYRGKIFLWNTENELNWTYVHVLTAGWRKGLAWFDVSFLEELLAVLHRSVLLGDLFTLTTMNFNIHDPLWMERLDRWSDYMDIVGLGAYPNYLFAKPVLSVLVDAAVRSAVQRSNDKPVMVLETGYPSGPEERGYQEDLQCTYHKKAIDGTIEEGGAGYILFRLEDLPNPPPWWELQAVEHYWGLVGIDGRRKEAYDLFAEIVASHR